MGDWYEMQMQALLDRASRRDDTRDEYIAGLKTMREMIDERIEADADFPRSEGDDDPEA